MTIIIAQVMIDDNYAKTSHN